jgi:hypothetical protein
VTVLVRPEAARAARAGEIARAGTVRSVTFRGPRQEVLLDLAGVELEVHLPPEAPAPAPGDDLSVALGPVTAQIVA